MSASRLVALGALLFLAAASVLPPGTPIWLRLIPSALSALLSAWAWRRASPAGGLAVLATGLSLWFGLGVFWQVSMLLAVGGLWLASQARPELGAPSLRWGTVPVGGTLVCALVTPLALGGWVWLLEPDLSDLTSLIPDQSLAVLLAFGLAFALINAFAEEWIWRGIIQPRLTGLFGAAAAIALQGASFGIAHSWGFPRGVAGVLLAGTWAVMLGVLRQRSGGLLSVVLAHIVADATIVTILFFMA